MDDKSGIGTVSHHLYTCSHPAVTAVRYPIRAGKILIRPTHSDWIVCGASRFTPIHSSLEALRNTPAVRTNLSGVAGSRSYTTLCTCFCDTWPREINLLPWGI